MSGGRSARTSPGASAEAIHAHYDVGDDFFALWLDETLTYSCAMWDGAASLEDAQLRKLDFHIAASSGDVAAARVLDVGCGWGSLLHRLVERNSDVQAIGLTVSKSQANYIESRRWPRVKVLLENWRDHTPQLPYDAIVSIGALEHFVRPEDSSHSRIATYREFFEHCYRWLRPGGSMSLQTIAYGAGSFIRGAISDIFPQSDLPRLHELAAGAEGLFEISSLRNDKVDYARTCRCWAERLAAVREKAEQIAGSGTVKHYSAYLAAAARGFDAGVFVLYRIGLTRIDDRLARLAKS